MLKGTCSDVAVVLGHVQEVFFPLKVTLLLLLGVEGGRAQDQPLTELGLVHRFFPEI